MKRLASALIVLGLAFLACKSSARDAALVWTAPGDDGMTGRATFYDARYKSVPVAGTDTLTWWLNAAQVQNLPIPGVAGTIDSVRTTGLPDTDLYFIIVTVDDAGNRSYFSNVAYLSGLDIARPAAIRGLVIYQR